MILNRCKWGGPSSSSISFDAELQWEEIEISEDKAMQVVP
jgi:hypothetical protein